MRFEVKISHFDGVSFAISFAI